MYLYTPTYLPGKLVRLLHGRHGAVHLTAPCSYSAVQPEAPMHHYQGWSLPGHARLHPGRGRWDGEGREDGVGGGEGVRCGGTGGMGGTAEKVWSTWLLISLSLPLPACLCGGSRGRGRSLAARSEVLPVRQSSDR